MRRDLLWRPAQWSKRLRSLTRPPRDIWIIPTRRAPPHKFRPDGGMMPLKTPSNPTQARSPLMFRKDHAMFLGFQVLAVSFHGNIRCPSGCRCRSAILRLGIRSLNSFLKIRMTRSSFNHDCSSDLRCDDRSAGLCCHGAVMPCASYRNGERIDATDPE